VNGTGPYFLPGANRTALRMCAAASAPLFLEHLLLEHLFHLSNFLLDFAAELFVLAFGGQIGVVDDLSRFFFNGTLRFMRIPAKAP
jgi:hypothetical protein